MKHEESNNIHATKTIRLSNPFIGNSNETVALELLIELPQEIAFQTPLLGILMKLKTSIEGQQPRLVYLSNPFIGNSNETGGGNMRKHAVVLLTFKPLYWEF